MKAAIVFGAAVVVTLILFTHWNKPLETAAEVREQIRQNMLNSGYVEASPGYKPQ